MHLTEKQKKRIERKKRKLVALANIVELNDTDKNKEATNMSGEHEFQSSSSEKSENTEEPISKRLKVSDSSVNETNKLIKLEDLTMEEYVKLKQKLQERKIYLTRLPRIRIREDGMKATIDIPADNRIPLFMKDIQHMLAYFLFGPYLKPYNSSPRWCLIEKFNRISNVSLVILEGLSIHDYQENEDKFPFLNQYSIKVEVLSPFSYEGDIVSDISVVSVTDNDRESLIKQFDKKDESQKNVDVVRLYKPAFPVQSSLSNGETHVPDRFPRTFLLLNLHQMVIENFPVPIRGELRGRYAEYRMTKDVYKEVTDSSPIYAIDCEMCLTSAHENELTRITVVNEQSEVVYETLVKPHNPIINYLTKYSGITKSMLENVEKRLEDVQNDLVELLPQDAILVGHSLNTDLHAMKMMHPYVIDTSVIFNLSGQRWRKPKLQALAWQFLGLQIQNSQKGHDSEEDSLSCLKLVQLKLSRDVSFGDAVMAGKQHLTDQNMNPTIVEAKKKNNPALATSIFDSLIHDKKTSIIISKEENVKRYSKFVTQEDETNYCQLFSIPSETRIIRKSSRAINDFKFTLIHLSNSDNEDKEKCISKLDKWCSKLWNCAKENSVSIVLFAGSPSSPTSNGVCLVEMKRPLIPPRNQ